MPNDVSKYILLLGSPPSAPRGLPASPGGGTVLKGGHRPPLSPNGRRVGPQSVRLAATASRSGTGKLSGESLVKGRSRSLPRARSDFPAEHWAAHGTGTPLSAHRLTRSNTAALEVLRHPVSDPGPKVCGYSLLAPQSRWTLHNLVFSAVLRGSSWLSPMY